MRLWMLFLFVALFVFSCAQSPAHTTPAADPKTFDLVGENFRFKLNGVETPDLVVTQGDTVRITLTSTDMPHDWIVDEFNAKTARVNKGEPSVSVEFVASKKGTFEYYCSVGKHRANGMVGQLIVQ